MNRMWRLWLVFGAVAILALGVAAAVAMRGDDKDKPVSSDVTDVTDGGDVVEEQDSPLYRARLDLAERLGVDVKEIKLSSIRHAGFDGCLGVYRDNIRCTEQFIAGYIAFFQVGEDEYRYHFGGDQFVAADFYENARVTDGLPVDPEMQADFGELLAEYARYDVAVRTGQDVEKVRVISVTPHEFTDSCLGVVDPAISCLAAIHPGVIILLTDGETQYRYHAGGLDTTWHMVLFSEQDLGSVFADEARRDLAERLGVEVEDLVVTAIIPTEFTDSCLGIANPAASCLAAIHPGVIILLSDGETQYRYHAGGIDGNWHMVAISFEEGEVTAEIDDEVVELQDKIREDLAERLGIDVELVSVVSFQNVTWADGCIGVHFPDALCSQALVDGFLMKLSAEGETYRYHGADNGTFVATDFEEGAIIRDPLPRQAEAE